jgi:hypothetical protein
VDVAVPSQGDPLRIARTAGETTSASTVSITARNDKTVAREAKPFAISFTTLEADQTHQCGSAPGCE